MKLLPWKTAPPTYSVAFSTRLGGVSEGPYSSLNLGRRTPDAPERVDENRLRFCSELGVAPAELAMNYQVHSGQVNRAVRGERGSQGDALWTDERGVPMLALGADCLLIGVVRAGGRRPAAAVIHAGWRGLLAGVVEATVTALGGRQLSAVIGPAIGACCYEVGEPIAVDFRERFGSDVVQGRNVDLWASGERALGRAGCQAVERLDLCTACHPDLFFSHRRDGGETGRQGVLAYVA